MQRMKRIAVVVGNAVVLAALGACYARILDYLLVPIASVFGSALSTAEKIETIAMSVGLACAAVFVFNRLMTRQHMLVLGCSCALFAYIHFYVLMFWPDLSATFLAFYSVHGLFALLSCTGAPLMTGIIWHRRTRLNGFGALIR